MMRVRPAPLALLLVLAATPSASQALFRDEAPLTLTLTTNLRDLLRERARLLLELRDLDAELHAHDQQHDAAHEEQQVHGRLDAEQARQPDEHGRERPHDHDGRDLQLENAEHTLAYAHRLWGRDVFLRTVLDGKPATLAFGDKGFSRDRA